MYDYGFIFDEPTSKFPQWWCKKCGAMFYDGVGGREPIALAHDAWHEKIDRLFDALSLM